MRVRLLLPVLVACAFPGLLRAQTSPSPIVTFAAYETVDSNPTLNRLVQNAPVAVGVVPGGAVLAYRSSSWFTTTTHLHIRTMSEDMSRVAEAMVEGLRMTHTPLVMYTNDYLTTVGYSLAFWGSNEVQLSQVSAHVTPDFGVVTPRERVTVATGYNEMPRDPSLSPDGSLGAVAQHPQGVYAPDVTTIRTFALGNGYASPVGGGFSVPVGSSPRLSGSGVLVYSDRPSLYDPYGYPIADTGHTPSLVRLWSVRLNTERSAIGGLAVSHAEPLFVTPRRISEHQVAWSGTGSLVVWQQRDNDGFNVYALRLDALGHAVGGAFAVATGPGHQMLPQVAAMVDGSYYVLWQDVREGKYTVRGQAVTADGMLLHGTAVESVDVSNGETGFFPAIERQGRLMAWTRPVGTYTGYGGGADVRGRWGVPEVTPVAQIVQPVDVSGSTATVRLRVRYVSSQADVTLYEEPIGGGMTFGQAAMVRENDSTFVAVVSGLPALRSVTVTARVRTPDGAALASEAVTFQTGSAPVISAAGIPSSSYVSRLVMTPEGRGFAAVRDLGLYRYDGAVWHSLLTGLPDRNVTDIAVDPADGARVLASTWATGLWSSVDAGLTWARVTLPSGFEQVRTVVFTREGTACLSGQGGVACRIGGAWAVRVPRTRLSSMLAVDGGLLGAQDGSVLVSTNLGETWEAVSAPGGTVAALAVTPGRTWLAATDRGLFASADRGATWMRVPLPEPAREVRAVAVDPRTGAVYVTHSRGEVVRVTADLGSAQIIGTVAGALAVAVTSSGEVLVGTADGGLRQVSSPTGVAGRPVASSLRVAVWPTPSTAGARVVVTGRLSEPVRAELHDVTGRRVGVLQVEESTGEAVLPSLPPGVYLLRVQQGTRTATTAVVMR